MPGGGEAWLVGQPSHAGIRVTGRAIVLHEYLRAGRIVAVRKPQPDLWLKAISRARVGLDPQTVRAFITLLREHSAQRVRSLGIGIQPLLSL